MIKTERLVLRDARPEDLDPLHAIFSDPETMRYWDRPAYTDLDQTRAFLDMFMDKDSASREEYILEYQGHCVGKAGIWKRPELGYILRRDLWGQGLVTEACRALLPRAWSKWPDMQVMTAELDPRNTGSAKLLEKLGFSHVRTEEKNFLYGESEWCDTAYYEMPRPASV